MAEANTASRSPELTARAIVIGLIVAMIIGSAYPYCVLKLGFGPNLSVVSVPSPSAMGIGMLITAAVLLTFILGGVAQLIWSKVHPESEKAYRIPLASGLICGEAIIAVVLAILAASGVNF